MRLRFCHVYFVFAMCSATALAQENVRPYGMLFGAPAPAPQSANVNGTQSQSGYRNQTSNKPKSPTATPEVLTPPQIIPSGEPATFAGHEAQARREAEYAQRQQELALQAQLEIEKAKANTPTVVMMQQPQPEVSLLNAITSIPALAIRSLLRW